MTTEPMTREEARERGRQAASDFAKEWPLVFRSAVVLVLIALIWVVWYVNRARPEPEHYVTNIAELDAAYEANEVATDTLIQGKVVEVSGTVRSIQKNFLGESYVSFQELLAATATFAKEAASTAGAINKGDRVTLLCDEARFVLQTTQLSNCRIKR